MFTPASARAASVYRNFSVQGGVEGATPHQLIVLLYDGLLAAIAQARGALARGDVAAKGRHVGRAVRIVQEGLKDGLDMEEGGEIAANLGRLYDYCADRLTFANLHNDQAALVEVASLVETLAQAWKSMDLNSLHSAGAVHA